jgi:hypothetical protein
VVRLPVIQILPAASAIAAKVPRPGAFTQSNHGWDLKNDIIQKQKMKGVEDGIFIQAGQ